MSLPWVLLRKPPIFLKRKTPMISIVYRVAAAAAAPAIVASGMAAFALGTDTGGSIRQPASLCGVVGFKPTYGMVSRYGLIAFASSLDQIGVFSHTVEDCAVVMDAIAGPDAKDSTSMQQAAPKFESSLTGDIKGIKIGIPQEYFGAGRNPAGSRGSTKGRA